MSEPDRALAGIRALAESLGVRWIPGVADCEAVAADMGIDPAAPMTREQHAEFARRMDERIAARTMAEAAGGPPPRPPGNVMGRIGDRPVPDPVRNVIGAVLARSVRDELAYLEHYMSRAENRFPRWRSGEVCYPLRSGAMVHIKPGCRCPR